MAIPTDMQYKSCFCDGSCRFNGICGGNRDWYGPGYVTLKGHVTNTTTPTKAEELRRKADLAQRDKRAKARANNEKIYLKYEPVIDRAATEGNYWVEISCTLLTTEQFISFKHFLKEDKGFHVEESGAFSLLIDWQERIDIRSGISRRSEILCEAEAPPTTEYVPRRK